MYDQPRSTRYFRVFHPFSMICLLFCTLPQILAITEPNVGEYRVFRLSEALSIYKNSFKVEYDHTYPKTGPFSIDPGSCTAGTVMCMFPLPPPTAAQAGGIVCHTTTTVSDGEGGVDIIDHYGPPAQQPFITNWFDKFGQNDPLVCVPLQLAVPVVPAALSHVLTENKVPAQVPGQHSCMSGRWYPGPLHLFGEKFIYGDLTDPVGNGSPVDFPMVCDYCLDHMSADGRTCVQRDAICIGHGYISAYTPATGRTCSLAPIGYYNPDHFVAYKCKVTDIAPYPGLHRCFVPIMTTYPVLMADKETLSYNHPDVSILEPIPKGTHHVNFTTSDYDLNGGRCHRGMFKEPYTLPETISISYDPEDIDQNAGKTHVIDRCYKCPLDNYCPDGLTPFPCSESTLYQDLEGQFKCKKCEIKVSECTGTILNANSWIERGKNGAAPKCHKSCCQKGMKAVRHNGVKWVSAPLNAESCWDTPIGSMTPDATLENSRMCIESNNEYAPMKNMVECLTCTGRYKARTSQKIEPSGPPTQGADMCVIVRDTPDVNATKWNNIDQSQCENGEFLVAHPVRPSKWRRGIGRYEYYYYCQSCPPGYKCNGRTRTKCRTYEYQNAYGESTCKKCPGSHLICCNEDMLETPDKDACVKCGTGFKFCCDTEQGETPEDHGCAMCEGLSKCCQTGQTPEDNGCYECLNDGSVYLPSADKTQCLYSYCRAGYYPGVVYGECLPCERGYYCDGKVMRYCAEGNYYQDLGKRAKCKECPDGLVPNNTRTGCVESASVTCKMDEFITNGHCERCPPGHYCEDFAKYPCPINTVRKDPESDAFRANCEPCPEHSVSSVDRTKCHDLRDPKGREVGNPDDKNDFVGWLGAHRTQVDEDGNVTDDYATALASLAVYKQYWCPEGYYYNGRLPPEAFEPDKCVLCEKTNACPGWLTTPYKCDNEGQYQPDEGKSYCLLCGADDMVPNDDLSGCEPSNCPAGMYVDKEFAQCLNCPRGNQCVGGKMYPCKDGFIAPSRGMRDCTKCNGNSFSNEEHTECIDNSIDPREGMPTALYPFADAVRTDNTVLAGSFCVLLLFVLIIGTKKWIIFLKGIVLGDEKEKLDRDVEHQKMRRQLDRLDIRDMQSKRLTRKAMDNFESL